LNNDEETLWKNMHSKHRNSIRRADKGNVKIKFGSRELLYDYLILDYDTWERSDKKGNSIEYYENIFNYLADNAVVVIGYKDSVPQGGAIFIFNKEGAYYMYGASKNNPEPGTMNLLHWKAMLYMKDRGVKKYNFVGCRINVDEGSKYQGIQRFKEHFGGDLQMGYMFKVVINKTMYSLFQKSIQTVNKTKYNDAIDQEIHKWIELNREE
jgi:lipid II:glycine glycyltransferase (peptidoglycan interpeptide bridge formation enzyme)